MLVGARLFRSSLLPMPTASQHQHVQLSDRTADSSDGHLQSDVLIVTSLRCKCGAPVMLLTTNQTPMEPTTLQPRITPKCSLPACIPACSHAHAKLASYGRAVSSGHEELCQLDKAELHSLMSALSEFCFKCPLVGIT